MNQGLVVGVDASRNRSGGARTHLIGLLTEGDPIQHGIREVHLWTYQSLSRALPDRPWLRKHTPPQLEQSLPRQLWWQATALCGEAANAGCDILFTTDASTLCRFKPTVVLSQDMLSYEPGVMSQFGYTRSRLRLLAILLVQNRAFRFADGVIFLTEYAARVIQQSCGQLPRVACISHGVGQEFRELAASRTWPNGGGSPIRCLYVSPASMFKHQWVVVRAIADLRLRGYNATLTLVGGGTGRGQRLLNGQLAVSDPGREFVDQLDVIDHKALPEQLAAADLFVFASSCESMPNALVEAMAAGLPIACSNRGPMPEILRDGGVFFDPEDADSIAAALERLITDPPLRERVATRARRAADQYSWARCADQTWTFVVDTYKSSRP